MYYVMRASAPSILRESTDSLIHHFLTPEKKDVAWEGGYIYYQCNSDNAFLLSFLLTCHPYIPFHFMK